MILNWKNILNAKKLINEFGENIFYNEYYEKNNMRYFNERELSLLFYCFLRLIIMYLF